MTGAPHDWQPAVLAALREAGCARGAGESTPSWTALGHGMAQSWSLSAGDERFFVKLAAASRAGMLEAEAEGLRAIALAAALRVPAVHASGTAQGAAFLALEWLELAPGGRDAALGRALAALHATTAPRFGWHRDNTIGTTAQDNRACDDWAAFFRDRRIAPQLALAARNGHGGALQRDGERLLGAIPALLAGHDPAPSLLHGDLWSGNAARLADGTPVVFDPAIYHGDREADLAMTELFGGFGADFYAAYREAAPLRPGYPVRRTLYNLYHVLNHLNLFGGGYRRQAEAMLAELIAQVR